MGCDIHLIVEKYNETTKRWELVGNAERDPDDGYITMPRVYRGRNYDLFAILANVRNGYGFGGVPTGEGFVPIAEPRGVPDNASPEFLTWVHQWGVDGHSHSWLLVQELLDCSWDRTTQCFGVVNVAQFLQWKAQDDYLHKSPRDYCGAVFGPSIVHVDLQEMEAFASSLLQRGWSPPEDYDRYRYPQRSIDPDSQLTDELVTRVQNTFTRITWTETYGSCCKDFLTNTLPKLVELGDPTKSRICFFFDN